MTKAEFSQGHGSGTVQRTIEVRVIVSIARPSVIHTGDDKWFKSISIKDKKRTTCQQSHALQLYILVTTSSLYGFRKKKFSHNFLGTFQFSSKFATLSFAAVGLSNYIKRTSCEREKFTDTGTDNAKDNELIGVKRKMFA